MILNYCSAVHYWRYWAGTRPAVCRGRFSNPSGPQADEKKRVDMACPRAHGLASCGPDNAWRSSPAADDGSQRTNYDGTCRGQ